MEVESTVGGDCIHFNGGMGTFILWRQKLLVRSMSDMSGGVGLPFSVLCFASFASLLCLFAHGVTHVGLPSVTYKYIIKKNNLGGLADGQGG